MKKPTIETVEASIARWQTRLRRAVRAIEKLEKQKKRLAKTAGRASLPVYPTVHSEPTLGALPPPPPKGEIDTSIPKFLERKKLDPAAQQIADEQAELKRRKAQGRTAKMKAKKSGELSKMPLTGRAALDAIRNA